MDVQAIKTVEMVRNLMAEEGLGCIFLIENLLNYVCVSAEKAGNYLTRHVRKVSLFVFTLAKVSWSIQLLEEHIESAISTYNPVRPLCNLNVQWYACLSK